MKKINVWLIIKVALVVVVIGMNWLSYPNLPDQMPVHWNFDGVANNYWPKQRTVFMMPVISILMFLGFAVLPQLDPKKKKYQLFREEWEIIQVGLLGFMTYVSSVTLYASTHANVNVGSLITAGIGALFILMGNYLSKIRQNFFIGIKTPWTLESEDNWNKTHRFASWCFVIAGVAIMTGVGLGLLMPALLMGAILGAGFLPVMYSFLLFKKNEKFLKPVLIGLALVFVMMLGLRIVAGEDSWMCVNGQWVAHGNPGAPMPTEKCR